MRLAVAAIARPTFDVVFAEETALAAFQAIDQLDTELIGEPSLLLDVDAIQKASIEWAASRIDALIVLQATFADSTLAVALAETTDAPLVLWAFPEERTGGRLRLNSLCGINLAGYVLKRLGREYRWLYQEARDSGAGADLLQVIGAAAEQAAPLSAHPQPRPDAYSQATDIRRRLGEAKVGIVGEHPTGFEPCAFDKDLLSGTIGVKAEAMPLNSLFGRSSNASDRDIEAVRTRLRAELEGIDELDPKSLDQSLRLHVGLRELVVDEGWDAIATRCWPECFTEFGAAACTPLALLSDAGVTACCEADAYGAVTGLVLQWLTGEPSFVADLVEVDVNNDTGVLWHCGLAPLSMAEPASTPTAALHSNRNKPLLNEFPLKAGRVTLARFSQSAGLNRLVVGGGEMLKEPLAFGGTAGVVQFDRSAADVLSTVIGEGLEHHYGIGYGDVREELWALGEQLGLPILEL